MDLAAALLLAVLIWLFARRYSGLAAKAVGSFSASSHNVTAYILAAMLLPLLLRIAFLPWVPPPEPHVHDEFGHLLVGDTLAAGRLANPPHPLWRHFETIYVLQQPTFSSIYPIGQGIILAIGKALLGNPWAGVLLSVALMCGATAWMLFGCLPPAWAALGGLLAALHFSHGIAQQWVNSYWGGAFCAFGGSLLLGALCRLRKSPSPAMALLAGAGWAIVWLSRPFESLLLLLVSWGLIAVLFLRNRKFRKQWITPIALILLLEASAGGITALHNRAVTGSFATLPYRLSQQTFGVPQGLLWQKPVEEPPLGFPELKEMYWWQRDAKEHATAHPLQQLKDNFQQAWGFFVEPWFFLPMASLLFLLADAAVLLAGGILVCALLISTLYPFFYPHYIAAYSCLIFFLILRGMMAVYQWSVHGKSVGRAIVLLLILGAVITTLRVVPLKPMLSRSPTTRFTTPRAQVAGRLLRLGGQHVVFVAYGADHNFHEEWVYNAANVDRSPIVWCRAINPADDAEVMRYYKNRRFWIADVDENTVRVSRYEPPLQLNAAAQSPWEQSQNFVLNVHRTE